MSVKKVGKVWSFRIAAGNDKRTGKRKQIYRSGFKTKREAERAMNDLLTHIESGAYQEPEKIIFNEYILRWLHGTYEERRSAKWCDSCGGISCKVPNGRVICKGSENRVFPVGRISLPSVQEALRDHKQLQESNELGLIVTSRAGGYLDLRNLLRKYKYLKRKAEVPDIPFHNLRHTHATMLMRMGKNPKVVSERLGHAHVSIILDIYSHNNEEMRQI